MPQFALFIDKNLNEHSTLKKVFSVLDFILSCCPELIDGLTGEITRKIESIEKKRNLGHDLMLRYFFFQINYKSLIFF